MTSTTSTAHIEVEALRVGMFVHLDVGWMSHPFPLSSFKLASVEQIATIRSLGVKKVRWSPDQTDFDVPTQPVAVTPAAPAAQDAARAALRARREALAAQRAALVVCERQFAEATRDCRMLTDLVKPQPAIARDKALALANALVDKMTGDGELCIRLLTEAAGDKAASHAVNVTLISLLLGRSFGLGEREMRDLGVGALLHDIGKLDLPERMRHLQDHFSAPEARYYEEHVTLGVSQAMRMGLPAGATLVIAQHHEHCDGSGFPLKHGSDRMTPASCIVALVNRYDNLCNPQIPSKALTPHEALSLLFAQGKNRFEPAILGGFIKMMGVYPPGSVVQLTDDRFALVVGVNSSRPLKPRVQVYDPRQPADDPLIVDLEHAGGLGIRRSIKPQALSREAIACLAPRQRIAYFFEPATPQAA